MLNKEDLLWAVLGATFLSIGVIFFGVGVFATAYIHAFQARAVEITGVISDIEEETRTVTRNGRHTTETSHYTYVDYTYESRVYDHVHYGFYTTGMEVGDDVTILVDPMNPSKIMAPGMSIFGYIFGGIGFVFTVMGAVFAGIFVSHKKKKERLLRDGWILQARITNITGTGNVLSRRQRPVVVYANYIDPTNGAEYRFASNGLYNVTADMRARLNIGYPINVYVEPGNFNNYYVDLASCLIS